MLAKLVTKEHMKDPIYIKCLQQAHLEADFYGYLGVSWGK